jgi:hypothetical protein
MSSETDDLCVPTPGSEDQTPPEGKSGISTSSADGLTESLSHLSPDPFLDEFKPAPSTGLGSSELDAIDLDVPPSAETSAGTDAFVAPKPPSSESFPALDLYAPPPSKDEEKPARAQDAAKNAEDWDDEGDDSLPWWCSPRIVVLVASYASAVTLGLIWVLWSHRMVREGTGVEPDAFGSRATVAEPAPGHRAGQSRKFRPPAPLPADRIVNLGQTLRLESLEVTPLEIAAGTVILKHEIRQREARRGGDDALTLKLRLKNVSGADVFVPLDEEFLRARAEGVCDSFIETGPTQRMDMFPLAIVSEWSIAGQEFRELNPGEWYETSVVSAPNALGHIDPATTITWRVRLRVDAANKTEVVGIRFRTPDIRKRPAHDLLELREPTERPVPDEDSRSRAGAR